MNPSSGVNLVISVISLAISGIAAYYSVQAYNQSEIIDKQVSHVVMASIGNKINRYAENAYNSYLFLSRLRDVEHDVPELGGKVEVLSLDFLHKQELSGISVSEDTFFQIAKSNGETAGKIAQCLAAVTEINSDIKQFSKITQETMTLELRLTLSVMPYRFKRVSMVCQDADKMLSEQIEKTQPGNGTLGELEEAQALHIERRIVPLR
ncbi:hypothetical protein QZQ41_16450 [Serratia marcescens]|uniref:hypothetical protein n=1 Tax=Serratia marcescens TaxID=615 RepID=UPI001F156467|nr:hypothetical protein [Serratia marcescens]MDP8611029.1 hypothetical protein [Serratia marcescens]MDP8616162.1 hypothetical protein [Serratia marcescens]MDP8646289.1 hypothetical protein [Serratia marcescens]MDP8656181.1 hypothetical protein [Serratia marcescens]MDP8661165.1 hypothetical protein [Serratia marcescens]